MNEKYTQYKYDEIKFLKLITFQFHHQSNLVL